MLLLACIYVPFCTYGTNITFRSFQQHFWNPRTALKYRRKKIFSFQGKFEVSMNIFHVCMNSSCVCKWFEIAASSKLINIFPLQIEILGLFCILSSTERKRSSSILSFWPQKVFTVSTAFPFQSNDISTSTSQASSLILKQSSTLTDMPVITWHAFSEFVPDLLGLWPALMLGEIFYQSRTAQPTSCKETNSSERSTTPLWAAYRCQSLRHSYLEHIDFLLVDDCRNIHYIMYISLNKNKPKASDATLQLSHRNEDWWGCRVVIESLILHQNMTTCFAHSERSQPFFLLFLLEITIKKTKQTHNMIGTISQWS